MFIKKDNNFHHLAENHYLETIPYFEKIPKLKKIIIIMNKQARAEVRQAQPELGLDVRILSRGLILKLELEIYDCSLKLKCLS